MATTEAMTTEAMIRALVICVLGATALVEGAGGQESTTSELLQKGIYLQETVGDLDGAIKVYKQIAQMAAASRANAAQAEYRIGVCLQKKGQREEAARTFAKLIEKYPEQTEVVARARQSYSDNPQPLLPAPWEDGEVLEYSPQLPMLTDKAPPDFVKMQYSVRSSLTHPGNWLFDYRIYSSTGHWITRVEAERETMRPVSSWQDLPVLGSQTEYQSGTARVLMKGQEPKVVAFNPPTFDANEIVPVIRRLALAPGYKTTFSTFNAMSPEGATKNEISVAGIDEVETPAGRFQCYRVEVTNANQRYWISTEAGRYPVKMKVGPMISELVAVRKTGSGPSVYHSEKLGLSLTVPAGWTAEDFSWAKDESGVLLIVPGSPALVKLSLSSAPSRAGALIGRSGVGFGRTPALASGSKDEIGYSFH
jgi:hypothetical protein